MNVKKMLKDVNEKKEYDVSHHLKIKNHRASSIARFRHNWGVVYLLNQVNFLVASNAPDAALSTSMLLWYIS